LAQDNYPLVKRYDLIKLSEQFTLDNIGKGWLPQISAYGQASIQSAVTELPEALKTMMAAQGESPRGISKFQYRVGVDVQQTVYDGGAIEASRNVARAQNEVELSRNAVDIYAIQNRVNDLYFSLLLIDERLALNNEHITMLQANVNKIASLHKGGVAMGSDVDVMRAELATAQQQRVEMQGMRDAVRQVLSLLCGKDIATVVKPDEPALATGLRPELIALDRQLQLTQAQEKALDSAIRPKVGLFAQGFYGYTGLNMFRDMYHRTPTLNGILGARITWNISSLYTRKNDRSKLALQRSNIENARETFLFNQSLQSTQQQGVADKYKKMLAQDDDIIALRRNVRKAAEAKLNAGVIDTNNLLQEITREQQAAINKSIHEVEYLKALYSLQTIQGQ
ncbi:MAG: TolC family protein, partial [Muribaculaceae bacterium]|nr:TolC family protein [Muribaculaceae bacterium]